MGERGRPRAFDREEALRRAMMTFWDQGYEGSSMTDLTSAMGIASPSLYACFGSKEGLFREAVELYGETEGGRPQRALAEARTAREGVAGMLRANVAAFADPETPPGCMLVLAAAAGTTKNADVRALLAERRKYMQTMVHERLDRGVAEGDLPAGADTGGIAAFYTTVMQGLSIQSRDGATRSELDMIIDSALAAWDGLVSGSSGGQSDSAA